jgi:lipoyl(octanoyl) transferase
VVKPVLTSEKKPSDSHPVSAVEWETSSDLVNYETAVSEMEARVEAIRAGDAPECVWLLEHPPLYTAGTSASDDELLDAGRFPVFKSGRGGQYTYHGPGQRVAYVMLDLDRRGRDIREFVCALEDWVIATLLEFGVQGERRPGRVGVWIPRSETGPGREDKIAAVGVRVRRWVTFHGISLNVNPDLNHYSGIVPCGIAEHSVTSLAELGVDASMEQVDAVLKKTFADRFGGAVPVS